MTTDAFKHCTVLFVIEMHRPTKETSKLRQEKGKKLFTDIIHIFYFCELLSGSSTVPRTTQSHWLMLLQSAELKISAYHLQYSLVWIVNFALPSILYTPRELAAVFLEYNALFVMSHKAVSMILADCSEPLRMPREEVAGLTQLYFNIVHELLLQRGGPAVSDASPCTI